MNVPVKGQNWKGKKVRGDHEVITTNNSEIDEEVSTEVTQLCQDSTSPTKPWNDFSIISLSTSSANTEAHRMSEEMSNDDKTLHRMSSPSSDNELVIQSHVTNENSSTSFESDADIRMKDNSSSAISKQTCLDLSQSSDPALTSNDDYGMAGYLGSSESTNCLESSSQLRNDTNFPTKDTVHHNAACQNSLTEAGTSSDADSTRMSLINHFRNVRLSHSNSNTEATDSLTSVGDFNRWYCNTSYFQGKDDNIEQGYLASQDSGSSLSDYSKEPRARFLRFIKHYRKASNKNTEEGSSDEVDSNFVISLPGHVMMPSSFRQHLEACQTQRKADMKKEHFNKGKKQNYTSPLDHSLTAPDVCGMTGESFKIVPDQDNITVPPEGNGLSRDLYQSLDECYNVTCRASSPNACDSTLNNLHCPTHHEESIDTPHASSNVISCNAKPKDGGTSKETRCASSMRENEMFDDVSQRGKDNFKQVSSCDDAETTLNSITSMSFENVAENSLQNICAIEEVTHEPAIPSNVSQPCDMLCVRNTESNLHLTPTLSGEKIFQCFQQSCFTTKVTATNASLHEDMTFFSASSFLPTQLQAASSPSVDEVNFEMMKVQSNFASVSLQILSSKKDSIKPFASSLSTGNMYGNQDAVPMESCSVTVTEDHPLLETEVLPTISELFFLRENQRCPTPCGRGDASIFMVFKITHNFETSQKTKSDVGNILKKYINLEEPLQLRSEGNTNLTHCGGDHYFRCSKFHVWVLYKIEETADPDRDGSSPSHQNNDQQGTVANVDLVHNTFESPTTTTQGSAARSSGLQANSESIQLPSSSTSEPPGEQEGHHSSFEHGAATGEFQTEEAAVEHRAATSEFQTEEAAENILVPEFRDVPEQRHVLRLPRMPIVDSSPMVSKKYVPRRPGLIENSKSSPRRRSLTLALEDRKWVLLDREGNTLEITPADVHVLLNGQSVDHILAESDVHRILSVGRSTQSAKWEPLIHESVQLLREESVGEKIGKKLSLERKKGNMLIYITRESHSGSTMGLSSSVRFITLSDEQVDLWRNSRDFNEMTSDAALVPSNEIHLVEEEISVQSNNEPSSLITANSDQNEDTALSPQHAQISTSKPGVTSQETVQRRKSSFRRLSVFRDILKRKYGKSDTTFIQRQSFKKLPKKIGHCQDYIEQSFTTLDSDDSRLFADSRGLSNAAEDNRRKYAVDGRLDSLESATAAISYGHTKEQAHSSSLTQFLDQEQEATRNELRKIRELLSRDDNGHPEMSNSLREVLDEIKHLRNDVCRSEGALMEASPKHVERQRHHKEPSENYLLNQEHAEQHTSTSYQRELQEELAKAVKKCHKLDDLFQKAADQNKTLEIENSSLLKKIEKLEHRTGGQSLESQNYHGSFQKESEVRKELKLSSNDGCSMHNYNSCLLEIQVEKLQIRIDEITKENSKLNNELKLQKESKDRLVVELATYKKELDRQTQVITATLEAGEVLVDDMESIKESLRNVGRAVHLNWDRVKARGNSITDVVHMCRSLINELCREYISTVKLLDATEKKQSKDVSDYNNLLSKFQEAEKFKCILNKKVDQLVMENDDLKSKFINMSKEYNTLKNDITEAEHTQLALEEELEKLSTEQAVVQQNQKIGDVIKEILSAHITRSDKNSIKELSEAKHSLQQNLHKMELHVKELEFRLDRDQDKMKQMKEAYENKIVQLEGVNSSLSEKLKVQNESNKESNEEFKREMQKKCANLEKDLCCLQTEKLQAVQDLEKLQHAHKLLAHTYKNTTSAMKALNKDLDTIKTENLSLKKQEKDQETLVLSLQEEKGDMLNQLKDLEMTRKTILECEHRIKELENRIQEHEQEEKDLHNIINCKNQHVHMLNESLSEKDIAVGELREQVRLLAEQCERYETDIAKLQNKLQEVEKDKETLSKMLQNETQNGDNVTNALTGELNRVVLQFNSTQKELELAHHKLKEKDMLVEECKLLKEAWKKSQEENSKYSEGLTVMGGLLTSYEEVSTERDNLIESCTKLTIKIQELMDSIKEKDEHVKELSNNYKDKCHLLSVLENKINFLHEQHNARLQECQIYLSEYKTQYQSKENEARSYEKQITDLEEQIRIQKELNTDLTSKVKTLEDSIRTSTAHSGALMEEMKSCKEVEENLKSLLMKERANVKKKEEEKDTAIMMYRNKLQELACLQERLDELRLQNSGINTMNQQASFPRSNEVKVNLNTFSQLKEDVFSAGIHVRESSNMPLKDVHDVHKVFPVLTSSNRVMEMSIDTFRNAIQELEESKRRSSELEKEKEVIHSELRKLQDTHINSMCELKQAQCKLDCAEKELDSLQQCLRETLESTEKQKKENDCVVEDLKREHALQKRQLIRQIKEMGLNKLEVEETICEVVKTKELKEKDYEVACRQFQEACERVQEEKLMRVMCEKKIQEFSLNLAKMKENEMFFEKKSKLLQQQVSEKKQIIDQLNKKVNNLKRRLQHALKQDTDIHSNATYWERKIKELNDLLFAAQEQFSQEKSNWEKALHAKENELFEYEQQVEAFEHRVTHLTSELRTTRKKLLEHRQEQGELHKALVNLQADKRDVNFHLKEVLGNLQTEEHMRKHLEHAYNNLLEVMKLKTVKTDSSTNQLTKIFQEDVTSCSINCKFSLPAFNDEK